MFKRKAVTALFFCAAAMSLSAQNPSPQLPPGPAQEKVRTACTECHDANIIVQQSLDRKAWTKEVDKMTKWGALVEPADRDAFIEYLSASFGPNNPRVSRQNPPAEEIKGNRGVARKLRK